MTLITLAFYAFGGLLLLGLLVMLLTRKVVYAGFALFITLIGNCALFILAGADFIGIAQLIIYVGGILVLLLFGVMLTNRNQLDSPRTALINLVPGALVAGGMLTLLVYTFGVDFGRSTATSLSSGETTGAEPLGILLLTKYLIPFEVASVFLLLALMGAGYIARKNNFRSSKASQGQ